MTTINIFNRKKVLTNIVSELTEIKKNVMWINSGGCGVFAKYSYELFNTLGYRPKLAVITRYPDKTRDDISNNRKGNVTEFTHIVVMVNGMLIDCHGMHISVGSMDAYDKGYGLAEGMPIELLNQWLGEAGIWNDTFDTKKYTPVIKKSIEKIKEKYTDIN